MKHLTLFFLLSCITLGSLSAQSRLYWTNSGNFSIYQSLLDGTEVEQLVSSSASHGLALAVDAEHEFMFWTGLNYIRRSKLDGSEVTIITQDYGPISGLAVDPSTELIYFADRSDNIYRCDYDASNVELLIETGTPEAIALDLFNEKIYWTSWTTDVGGIYRANLDGTNIDTLITEGLGRPWSITLDVENQKFYWSDQLIDKIARADLDGQNQEDILTDIEDAYEVVIDPSAQKLYWINTESFTSYLQQANVDGTGLDTLIRDGDGLSFPKAMVLVEDEPSSLGTLETAPEITMAPNPATEIVQVRCAQPIKSLRLLAADGRVVREQQLNALEASVRLKGLASGFYVVQLTLLDGSLVSRKLLVD